MNTVVALLHEGAQRYGDRPYLGEKTGDQYEMTSFVLADRLSLAFATALAIKGFKKGDCISILSEGKTSWVIGEFGLLKAGCISVPLSTKLSPEEIVFRLDHSESKAILISENNFQKVADIIEKVAIKPLVICISDKTKTMEALVAKTALSLGKDLLYYHDLLDEGQAALDSFSGEKSIFVDGKPVVQAMQEREASIQADDTVTISYTSGTTGNPKGIMLSHRNYLDNAENSAKIVEVKTGWKSLIMLPLDHSFAHTVGIYIFLLNGITMCFVDARGGPMAALRNLPKNLTEVNPDFLLTVPALSGNFMKKMIQGVAEKGPLINGIFERGLRAGIARAGNGFNKPPFMTRLTAFFPWALAKVLIFPKLSKIFGTDIKFCVGGGALLEIKQQEFFNAIGVPVYQGYGLTENAPIICSNSAKRHKFGTSGVIIPNLEVRIMKDDTTESAPGEKGQIVTRGGSVMKGYFKNTEATEETLRDGWLWSGDLGFIDSDGFLVVTGREKALLIAADGEKYSPETIEEAIINTSKYVNQIMAYNNQCKFTSALVTVNASAIKKALASGEISKGATENEAIEAVIAAIKEDILAFTTHPDYSSLPTQWRPASFALIASPFDESNGLINSTLKLVRHKVCEVYKDKIDEVYAAGLADPNTKGNKKAVQELSLW
ncbi:MAG TPA: AMP-binding protein [Treponemataceae bacterium]|nr:AMP-binding protein [Treponemataceae bacterium]